MSPIHVDLSEHIATVTIDFPPVNAMSRDEYAELTQVFDALWESDARVAILTGSGQRVFCAGANVKTQLKGKPTNDHGRTARECLNSIYECAIPVVGAINGAALGGGLAIAASCDYLIASTNATFGLPEIDVGLLGGAKHLSRLFPQNYVRRMHFTGERASAEEALRLHAVTDVVPAESLMEKATSHARSIAEKMPAGIRLAKESLNVIEFLDLKNGYRFEQTRTDILIKTDDAQEAKKAFLEKRKPIFRGS
ncbi:enoyl-CoA hydratase/isomerase family protein [Dehalococcoidia bacterium]|nr:enoyl-CoA hydratase/isomerase family protein [Dehalococcoidia bacterium]